MPAKDPTTWSIGLWLLAIGMAFGGGLVNFYARVKRGHARAFNFIELIGEVVTSGFVGLMVFMVMESFDQPVGLCAVGAGIGGHMATRLIFAAEQIVEARVKKFTAESAVKMGKKNES